MVGSELFEKDIIVGFDIYHECQHLRILLDGIRCKYFFKPFVQISKLYFLQQPNEQGQMIIELLKEKTCANSHLEFHLKYNNPLWKNLELFLRLPFKLNEDINPTKASHSSMYLDHQKLIEEECNELL